METVRSLFKDLSASIGAFVPQKLGRALYLNAAKSLKKKAQKKWGDSAQAWGRNSVLTSAFRPFSSDLDVSIFVPANVKNEEWIEFREQFRKFKRIFPWLGELNVYDLTSRNYLESANFFVLERDPSLKDPLHISERKPIKAEALIFLMKTLENDWPQLVSAPMLRVPEWQVHWQSISDYFDGFKDFEMKEILNRILQYANLAGDDRKSIIQYLNNSLIRRVFDMDLTLALWQFFPNRFSFRPSDAPDFKGLEAQCMDQAISWEVWSLWAQRGAFDVDHVRAHLKNLLDVAEFSYSKTEKVLFDKTQRHITSFLESLS